MTDFVVELLLEHPGFRLDVSFRLPPRGVTCVFGASGAGKTTLLRGLAGLIRPLQGRLVSDGICWQDETVFVPPHRRRIGYVFQEALLFPHLTVRDNLNYGYERAPA